jgi:AcrR family transcriptional regulator
MEVLAQGASAGLSLNKLVQKFHVTKGSFYWHFEGQADFHSALVDHWHETSLIFSELSNVWPI